MPQERQELQRLVPRHFNIMELCLQGYTQRDIADSLGMSQTAISLIVNSPVFQDELAKRRSTQQKMTDEVSVKERTNIVSDLRQKIEEAAMDAADVHIKNLKNENPRVAQVSADAILDRVLAKNTAPTHITVIEKGAIELLQVALMESAGSRVAHEVPPIERQDVKNVPTPE